MSRSNPIRWLWILAVAGGLSLIPAASETTQAASGAVIYSYDKLGRLVCASYDTGVMISYSYDAVGNRTSKQVSTGGKAIWGCFNWNAANWNL